MNHHITIIKSSSMNEDSKECSTTVCIQWHASVIVAEKTLTKLAAAGGHELVRQGCFFCLAGALLVPLSTWLSFTANPHAKCFSRKNTHMQMSSKHEIAYLVQDWIFAKKNTIYHGSVDQLSYMYINLYNISISLSLSIYLSTYLSIYLSNLT